MHTSFGPILTLCVASFVAPPLEPISWPTNATLQSQRSYFLAGLGAAQGVSLHDGKVYIYGDVWNAKPRIGVIREYTREFKPTGRVIWLRKEGKPLLLHPTGLTWDSTYGTFLGDTVKGRSVIYRLDWARALEDGHLDRAVLDVVDDDVAVNGGRPEFVKLGGKTYLATADYGDIRPEIRLYDLPKLLAAKRSSAPGVVVHRILCGPYNQNLHWDEKTSELTCIQNVVAGKGWRLDVLNLPKAVADGRAWGEGVRVKMMTLPPRSELEGYRVLPDGRSIFIVAARGDNVFVGKMVADRKK